jgi:hypothetical protein
MRAVLPSRSPVQSRRAICTRTLRHQLLRCVNCTAWSRAWSSHCRNQTAANSSFFRSYICADCDVPVPYVSTYRSEINEHANVRRPGIKTRRMLLVGALTAQQHVSCIAALASACWLCAVCTMQCCIIYGPEPRQHVLLFTRAPAVAPLYLSTFVRIWWRHNGQHARRISSLTHSRALYVVSVAFDMLLHSAALCINTSSLSLSNN